MPDRGTETHIRRISARSEKGVLSPNSDRFEQELAEGAPSQVALAIKNLPANPLQYSCLENPGELQSMGSHKVGHNE